MADAHRKINTKWCAGLAYILGIIASDGNISPDLRHVNITTKDLELVVLAKQLLNIKNKIGRKGRGGTNEKRYFVLQFGDVHFIAFLKQIGITSKKSKTIGKVLVNRRYFRDFLRGIIDGDGCVDSYTHLQTKLPQTRVRIASASQGFIDWLQHSILIHCRTEGGWVYYQKRSSVKMLTYAKRDSVLILKHVYYPGAVGLSRKRVIALDLIGRVA